MGTDYLRDYNAPQSSTLETIRLREEKSEVVTSENYIEAWHQAGAGKFAVLGKYKHPAVIFVQPASSAHNEEVAHEIPGE